MYNPYQLPSYQPLQLVRVNGIQGARAYQMPPNSVAALFDSNADVMYIRSTDGAGFPQIRTFTFQEQKQNVISSNAITKQDIDRLQSQIDDLKGMVQNGKQSVRKSNE